MHIWYSTEGTTTNGEFLLPFKTGGFLAKAPVLPVILRYHYQRFSPAWDSISGVSTSVVIKCHVFCRIRIIKANLIPHKLFYSDNCYILNLEVCLRFEYFSWMFFWIEVWCHVKICENASGTLCPHLAWYLVVDSAISFYFFFFVSSSKTCCLPVRSVKSCSTFWNRDSLCPKKDAVLTILEN